MRYIFPYTVAHVELAASIVYMFRREWRLAILWGGYAIAAFALAGQK
jgi:hypothetical protein